MNKKKAARARVLLLAATGVLEPRALVFALANLYIEIGLGRQLASANCFFVYAPLVISVQLSFHADCVHTRATIRKENRYNEGLLHFEFLKEF